MTTNKDKVIDLLKPTKRPYIEDLIEHMDDIGFFDAPASSCNHLHKKGGLVEHSLNVCETALALNDALGSPCPISSVIIASLLHDLGKCGDYNKKYYVDNVLKSGSISEAKPFKRNPELKEIGHSIRSLCIINRFIDLTEDEEFAIRFHDGLYERANFDLQGNETPLYIIIHFADLWSSRITEMKGE